MRSIYIFLECSYWILTEFLFLPLYINYNKIQVFIHLWLSKFCVLLGLYWMEKGYKIKWKLENVITCGCLVETNINSSRATDPSITMVYRRAVSEHEIISLFLVLVLQLPNDFRSEVLSTSPCLHGKKTMSNLSSNPNSTQCQFWPLFIFPNFRKAMLGSM